MAQYRQWLHYRHVDRQLQAQKEQLTATLTRLRENISDIHTSSGIADNRIIQALTLYTEKFSNSLESEGAQPSVHGQQLTPTYEPLPPIPYKAMDSLAEENDAQPDEHAPTEPQVALPWWLQRAALSATQSDSLDSQSVRTNRLVQRWLERWGRQEEQDGSPSTNGHYPPVQQERQSS